MTREIDEAIERYTSNAEYERTHGNLQGYLEFKQLAEWLRDYKRLKEQEPSENAISRQAVDTLVDELARAISDERCCMSRGRSTATIMQDILDLPSVKPQERTGHWNLFHTTEHGMREDSYFKCNRCNYESYKEYNFCPDCGAKMVEPQERRKSMTREEIIRNLKYTMEKHKNDTVNTFDTNVSVMCKDILEYLEQEPCEDAISRQAVLDMIEGFIADATSHGISARLDPYYVMNGIKYLPSVKPQEPKTVIYSGDGYADGEMVYDMAECPNCGYEYEDGDKDWGLPFCPNCGQKLNWERSDKE